MAENAPLPFKFNKIPTSTDGWGPSSLPDKFKDMPYQPFSKSDRLGKETTINHIIYYPRNLVSDWTGVIYTDKRFMNKYTPQFGANSNQFAYFHEDEENFQLVDTVRVQKPPYQRGRNRFNQNKLRREREKKIQLQNNLQVLSKVQKSRERDRQRQLRKWQKQFGRQQQDRWKERNNVRPRESTVIVRDSWTVLEEIDFPRLTKLKLSSVKEPQDLYTCGNLSFYDRQYDRVSTKNEKPLRRIDRVFHNVPTVLDPIIRKLRKEGNVFATDDVLATLMSCTRSIYPWDIIVNIVSNKIFLDKRENSNINTLSVSETATEPPQDDDNTLNDPRKLALEARFINNNFTQQVLLSNDKTQDLEFENPFQENQNVERVASVGYRYRKWDLGNDNILVARTEHDAVTYAPNGELLYINIKALNEWDYKQSGGIDWRSKIDNQRGAVLATELKNNNSKLAKWTICSLLSGSSQIKFGYVSRRQVNDSTKHVILGMQQFKPTEFAQQINLNMDNAWAILRCIIDMCKKLKQGKYLIMKDPNKPMIRIYDIPDKTFDNSDSEDDSETTNSEDDD